MPNRRQIINPNDPQRSYIDLDVSEPVVFISVLATGSVRRARRAKRESGLSPASGRNQVPLDTDLSDRLIKMDIHAKEKRAVKAEFTFWNEDLGLTDSPITHKGSIIIARWGYSGYLGRKRKFRVKKVKGTRARVKTSGQITIVAYSQDSDLGDKPKSRAFANITINDLVRQIARPYGISEQDLILDPSQKGKVTKAFQVNQTDQAFLTALAQKLNWVFSFEDGVLTFAPHYFIDQCKPIATWSYFVDEKGWIKRFEPEGSTLAEMGSVTVKSRDPRTGKLVSSTATARTKKGKSLARYVPVKPIAQGNTNTRTTTKRVHRGKSTQRPGVIPSGQVINRPGATAKQVKQEAQSRLNQQHKRLYKARALNVGDPLIWKGNTVRFNAVGKEHSGNWIVVEARHIIDVNGYDLDMKLRRSAANTLGRGVRPTTEQKTKAQFASGRSTGKIASKTTQTNAAQTGTRSRTRSRRR